MGGTALVRHCPYEKIRPCDKKYLNDRTVFRKLCSAEILARTGVYLDHFALVNEKGNSDLGTGFESSGFKSICSGIALEAGFGFGNFEVNECGRLYAENAALVGENTANHVLFNELEVIGKLGSAYGNLLIAFGIHEVVEIAVVIEVFHLASVDVSCGELVGGAESLFDNAARNNISYLCTNESCALAGFNMLEFDYLPNSTIHLEGYAVSEIAG